MWIYAPSHAGTWLKLHVIFIYIKLSLIFVPKIKLGQHTAASENIWCANIQRIDSVLQSLVLSFMQPRIERRKFHLFKMFVAGTTEPFARCTARRSLWVSLSPVMCKHLWQLSSWVTTHPGAKLTPPSGRHSALGGEIFVGVEDGSQRILRTFCFPVVSRWPQLNSPIFLFTKFLVGLLSGCIRIGSISQIKVVKKHTRKHQDLW